MLPCFCALQAVKLTSVKAQLPYEYYSLGICKPQEITYKSENLGMSLKIFTRCLNVDRIENFTWAKSVPIMNLPQFLLGGFLCRTALIVLEKFM